jgi:hypothetical protein
MYMTFQLEVYVCFRNVRIYFMFVWSCHEMTTFCWSLMGSFGFTGRKRINSKPLPTNFGINTQYKIEYKCLLVFYG